MKIAFRARALRDLAWWRQYYRSIFPEGRGQSQKHFRAAQKLLLAHPHAGHSIEGFPGVRELTISRTPFSFLYVIENDQIIVIRLFDGRSEPAERL